MPDGSVSRVDKIILSRSYLVIRLAVSNEMEHLRGPLYMVIQVYTVAQATRYCTRCTAELNI